MMNYGLRDRCPRCLMERIDGGRMGYQGFGFVRR